MVRKRALPFIIGTCKKISSTDWQKDIAVVILCPVMMVWWLSDFLGGGAMACVRAAQATGYSVVQWLLLLLLWYGPWRVLLSTSYYN